MKNHHGFTLMELLIVVVIIGVLASLVLPRMTAQTEKANVMEAMTFLGMMRKGEIQFENANGYYTSVPGGTTEEKYWTPLGISVPNYNRPNASWLYGADATGVIPGRVYATRSDPPVPPQTQGLPRTSFPRGRIYLNPNGTWDGTIDYRQGQPLAPTK